MFRFSVAIGVLVVAAQAALAAGPVALVAVVAIGAMVFVGMRGSQPSVDRAVPLRRGSRWFAGSAIALVGAVAIPAVDGGELNEVWWSAMAVLVVAATACAVVGAALALGSQPRPRRTTTP